jgi:hypothetical protein
MRILVLAVVLGACGDDSVAPGVDAGARPDAGPSSPSDAGSSPVDASVDAPPADASAPGSVLVALDLDDEAAYRDVLFVQDGVHHPDGSDLGARFEHQPEGSWDGSGAAKFWPVTEGEDGGYAGLHFSLPAAAPRVGVGWTVRFGPRFAAAMAPGHHGTCKPLVLIPADDSLEGPWEEEPEWPNPRVILHYRSGEVGGRSVMYSYVDNNVMRPGLDDPPFVIDDHLDEWLWFHVLADKGTRTIEFSVTDRTGAVIAFESLPMARPDGRYYEVSMAFTASLSAPDEDAYYLFGEVVVADGPVPLPRGFAVR